jgi:hypothetical protein
MKNPEQDLREQQMEVLLRWEGRLNNARLRELFNLGNIRASQWIREFRELHPSWLQWDSKARSFYPTAAFYRDLQTKDSGRLENSVALSRYIVLVGLPHAVPGHHSDRVVWAAYPELATPNPQIFATLLCAAREHQIVDISYRSMGNPALHSRTISPHSLIRVGRRWHVRAYCDNVGEYRDYTLGRIGSAKILADRVASKGEAEDDAWNTPVRVRLGAHPQLSMEQIELIRFEYFNGTSGMVETCRGALVSYFIQDIRAATDPVKQCPPDYQLAVENIEEIRSWLFPN